MLASLVNESKEIVDILNTKVDRKKIANNAARKWKLENGVITHTYHQYIVIEVTGDKPHFEGQALAICNIALNHFFANLQEELQGFNNPEGITEMLAGHKTNIQTTLLSSVDNVSKMVLGVDHCFIMTAYYTQEALTMYVVALPQWVDDTLSNSVFTHIFNIQP